MPRSWAVPRVAVDAILLHRARIVLVRRGKPPFAGMLALPGGFVEFGERLDDAVEREAREETGLDAEVVRLLGVYGDPGRDPRGHTISVAYVLRSMGGTLAAGTDAAATKLVAVSQVPRLAFDHSKIVRDYRESERAMLTSSRRGASIVPSRAPGGIRGRPTPRTPRGT